MYDYEDYLRDKGFSNSGFSRHLYKDTPQEKLEREKAIKLAIETLEKHYGKEHVKKLQAEINQRKSKL
jgi:hypothetical protein